MAETQSGSVRSTRARRRKAAGALQNRNQHGNDDGTVRELRAHHPLDEIEFDVLQVGLGHQRRGINLFDGIGNALRL
jgi:hypothetical protein